MKHTLVLALWMFACGDAESTGGSSSKGGGTSSVGGENPGGGLQGGGPQGGGGQGGGAGAGAPALPTCVLTCATVDDCVSPSPISDADNWACETTCVYLGCTSTSECQTAFANSNYECIAVGSIDVCQLTCDVAPDCAAPTPVSDVDNWACTNQRCEYLGCNSTEECQASFQDPNYDCIEQAGLPTCVRTCTTPEDCGSPSALYDQNNWACESGRCEYLGCNTNEECIDTLMNGNYSCQ